VSRLIALRTANEIAAFQRFLDGKYQVCFQGSSPGNPIHLRPCRRKDVGILMNSEKDNGSFRIL
jgi:hypothetical protein